MIEYRVYSHLGIHYEGYCRDTANLYADSVIEVESCFGYKTWPTCTLNHFTNVFREQVCSEDIYKFVSIVGTVEDDQTRE